MVIRASKLQPFAGVTLKLLIDMIRGMGDVTPGSDILIELIDGFFFGFNLFLFKFEKFAKIN